MDIADGNEKRIEIVFTGQSQTSHLEWMQRIMQCCVFVYFTC